ncbi:MAG: hypothetical protein WC012_10355 [Thiohalomonadaceae bacterium]
MEKKIILGVLGVVALAIVVGVIAPALLVEPERPRDLPWQIEKTPEGRTQVFGITLGETSLAEAERLLGTPGEVTLFNAPGAARVVEAYFDPVNLSGLDAKMVLGVAVPTEMLEPMYDRGIRASQLGSGTQKVTLAPDDVERVRQMAVDSITYMPSVNLSPEQVEKRFGVPAERRRETGDEPVEHWLYPELGLDVAISERKKEVLQYVLPADFERLTRPLQDVPVVR